MLDCFDQKWRTYVIPPKMFHKVLHEFCNPNYSSQTALFPLFLIRSVLLQTSF